MSTALDDSRTASDLATLIARSGDGDERAFTDVYDATVPRVYGLALRVLRSPVLAEEAALEAYLEAWRTSPTYDEDQCTPVVWLLVKVLRRVLARLSPASEAISSWSAQIPMNPTPDVPRLDARAASSERRQLVEAVSLLSPAERSLLVLGCRDGYDAESSHLVTVLWTLLNAAARDSLHLVPNLPLDPA